MNKNGLMKLKNRLINTQKKSNKLCKEENWFHSEFCKIKSRTKSKKYIMIQKKKLKKNSQKDATAAKIKLELKAMKKEKSIYLK